MVNKNPMVNNMCLDRTVYHAVDSNGAYIGYAKVIAAATAFEIEVDLNGVGEAEFFIHESAGVNNIATFNLTAKYYEENGVELTGTSQTIVVPQTTAGQNQYVVITGAAYMAKAAKMKVTGTLPFTLAYTATLFVRTINQVSGATGDEVIQPDAALLNMTEANSGAIKTAVQAIDLTATAIKTAVELIDDAVYVDGAAFTYSASKTLAMGGAVDPTRTGAAGEILVIAVDDIGQVRNSDFDSIGKYSRVAEINAKNTKFDYSNAIISLTASSVTTEVYLDMDYYDSLSLQFILGGGSAILTVEGTLQNDGTVAASCTYKDVTNDAYGAATITASDALIDPAGFFGQFKYVKIKVVPTAATLTVHAKRKVR